MQGPKGLTAGAAAGMVSGQQLCVLTGLPAAALSAPQEPSTLGASSMVPLVCQLRQMVV